MTAFLQTVLPITAYIAYVNDDSLIGFNFLNYSIANFENDVKLKGFGVPSDIWKGIPWKQPQ